MLTLDYALRLYTDEVNAYQDINFDYYKTNLAQEDYKEFEELIKFIDLFKSSQVTDRYKTVFEKVNQYKENEFDLKSAANFRSTDDISDQAKSQIDQLFDEEFEDE